VEHVVHLFAGGLPQQRPVVVPAARELPLELFRLDLATRIGCGWFAVVAVNEARVVVDVRDCGLPVLVQPLQRGAAEAGIPIGR
jgi:hypothetical protein